MKKVLNVIVIVLCIVLLSIAIPWIVSNYANEYVNISDITKILSAICSLATLVIAILLFNKYVIDSKLIEKKSERVFDLISVFNNIDFMVEGKNLKGVAAFFLIVRFNDKDIKKHIKDYSDLPICFKMNFWHVVNKLIKLCDDPFMPNNIAESVKSLNFHSFTEINNDQNKYAIVSIGDNVQSPTSSFISLDTKKDDEKNLNDRLGIFNNNYKMTLNDLVSSFETIRKEIKKWLKNNSSRKLEINF